LNFLEDRPTAHHLSVLLLYAFSTTK